MVIREKGKDRIGDDVGDNEDRSGEFSKYRKYQEIPVEDLEKELQTSETGLSSEEGQNRLEKYGYNELIEKKLHPLIKFLTYFWGPIPWMIEVAAILSALIGHWSDFGVILLLLIVNAVVGFWEEHKADTTIEQLKKHLSSDARVLRDEEWETLDARELVPGDVVHVKMGDVVPADARLLSGDPILLDNSALTGESLPVTSESGDAIYSGSTVKQGAINAIVYATGKNTYFGRTARLVEDTQEESHFQKAIIKIGDYLIVLAVALVALIILVSLYRGDALLTTLQFALILTVAAIPVALPTVLSITMAVGAQILAARKAVVSRLPAIEEMAGIDILCSDKTGTLTQNSLTIGDPALLEADTADEVLLHAALASERDSEDPIDTAVHESLGDPSALDDYEVQDFDPFDPVKKRTEVRLKGPHGELTVSKGAPQVILDLCEGEDRERVEEIVEEFAEKGYRSLGVAKKAGENWKYLGLLPMFDPPREDAESTVARIRRLGVRLKMLTGDQAAIAKQVASQLDMGTNILNADIFGSEGKNLTANDEKQVEDADGFAQVYPEHKFTIVDILQKQNHIVGMTGDGVNDAPALKKADVGIAVSGATDAARSSSDIVLLEAGIDVIEHAIEASRRIFKRMNSYAIYRIAETIRVLLFMTASILLFNFYPLTAIMIVLLALLNDGAIISIAYDRAKSSGQPEKWNMTVVLGIATVLGVIGVFQSFGLFYLTDVVYGLDRGMIQTIMYLKLSVAGHLTIFLTRTRGPFWKYAPAPVVVIAVLATQIAATFFAAEGVLMQAIGWQYAGLVWAYALSWWLVNDFVKRAAYRIFDSTSQGLLTKKRSPAS